MGTRFRWLTIEPFTKKHVAMLSVALGARLYRESDRTGFNLITDRADCIDGEFIRRQDFSEEITDPLGQKISVPRISLQQTGFKLALKTPQLELVDPAANARDLIEKIAAALNYAVSITPIEIDPLEWAKALRIQHPTLKILSVSTGEFTLTNEAVGTFAIKGTQDVEMLIPILAGNRNVSAKKVVCSWISDDGEAKVELRRSGVGVVLRGNSKDLRTVMASQLGSLVKVS